MISLMFKTKFGILAVVASPKSKLLIGFFDAIDMHTRTEACSQIDIIHNKIDLS